MRVARRSFEPNEEFSVVASDAAGNTILFIGNSKQSDNEPSGMITGPNVRFFVLALSWSLVDRETISCKKFKRQIRRVMAQFLYISMFVYNFRSLLISFQEVPIFLSFST